MRVCERALSSGSCPYGHLWAAGAPYAIHSHPYQGTAMVENTRRLDRVLRSWPGYVEFEPGIEWDLMRVVVDIAGDAGLAEAGLTSAASSVPEAFAKAMDWARKHLDGQPSWLCASPSWDDVMAGGTGKRCHSESAGQRCELSSGHSLRHFAQGTSRSGRVIYTYAW